MKRSSRRPPILAIVILVSFLLVVLYFVTSRQLQNSKLHRLRLLAGFASRVEATVPDLATRFVRIARTEPARDIPEYVEQIPDLTYVRSRAGEAGSPTEEDLCWAPSGKEESLDPAIELIPQGRFVYFVYRGPVSQDRAERIDGLTDEESCEPPPGSGSDVAWRQVKARLDLEAVLGPTVVPGNFESLLVAEAGDGQVLFQHGEPELDLASMATVHKAVTGDESPGEGRGGPVGWFIGEETPDIGRHGLMGEPATGSILVEVAEVDYRLFYQPILLELPELAGDRSPKPVRWVAGGLTSRAELLSASFTSSPILLFALFSVFPLGVLAWPFLKVWLISPRQRLTRVDVGFLVLSTVTGCFLLTILVLQLQFWSHVEVEVDGQLRGLSASLEESLFEELGQAYEQLERLDTEEMRGEIRKLPMGPKAHNGASEAQDEDGEDAQDSSSIARWADSPDALGEGELDPYPIFHSVFWVDEAGDQQLKLALRVHSLRKASVAERLYFECARGRRAPFLLDLDDAEGDGAMGGAGQRGATGAPSGPVRLCLQSVISNTGGADQAILALPPVRAEVGKGGSGGDSTSQARQPVMATQLASLSQAVLPRPYGFAVVDTSEPGRARVLFHSDPRRILTEDLLKASDEDTLLASMLEKKRQGVLGIRYWGSRHRAHVTHLPGVPWALVTYRGMQDLRMRNLELMYDLLNPSILLFLAGVVLVTMFLVIARRRVLRALWPDANKNPLYLGIILVSFLVVVVADWVLIYQVSRFPDGVVGLFGVCMLLPLLALLFGLGVLTFCDWDDLPKGLSGRIRRWLAGAVGTLREELLQGSENRNVRIALGALLACTLGLTLVVPWLDELLWGEPDVQTSLGILGLSLVATVILLGWWRYRRSFERRQRKRAYVLTMACWLAAVAVVPAVGLFELARQRQWAFIVQEVQEGLAGSLEQREQATFESSGTEAVFYAAHRDELELAWCREMGELYESTLMHSKGGAEPSGTVPEPDQGTSVQGDGTPAPSPGCPSEAGWPWVGWLSEIFSARPVPVNDLSSEPQGVDLSRFDVEQGRAWCWQDGAEGSGPVLLGELRRAWGTGESWSLGSQVPFNAGLVSSFGGERTLGWLVYGVLGLLWIGSPFLFVGFISRRVMLSSLAEVAGSESKESPQGADKTDEELIGLAFYPTLDEVKDLFTPPEQESGQEQDDAAEPNGQAEKQWISLFVHNSKRVEEIAMREQPHTCQVLRWDSEAEWPEEPGGRDYLVTGFDPTTSSEGAGAERTLERIRRLEALWQHEKGRVILAADVDVPWRLPDEDDPTPEGMELREKWEELRQALRWRRTVRLTTTEVPDFTNLRELLEPENLQSVVRGERQQMLLIIGVPELALRVIDEEYPRQYVKIDWSKPAEEFVGEVTAFEEAELQDAKQQDSEPKSLLVTRFRIDLEVEEDEMEGTTEKLRRLAQLHRSHGCAIVVLGDTDPSRVLTSPDFEAEPDSSLAMLAREWSGLLGAFTFRYATDRGEHGVFEQELQYHKAKILTSLFCGKGSREVVEPVAGRGDGGAEEQSGQGPEEDEERERRKRACRQLAKVLFLYRKIRDGDPEDGEVAEHRSRLTRSLEELERSRSCLEEDPRAFEALRTIELVREECHATRQLQRVGGQVLQELSHEDAESYTQEKMISKIALLARSYYQALWASTSEAEKVILTQLAYEGLVSPQNRARVLDLMHRGVIVRDPELRLMNRSFAEFIRHTVNRRHLLEWEAEEGTSVWSILRWLLPVPLLLLGGFMFITQRDAVSSAIGFLIAAASITPTLINLFGHFEQRFAQAAEARVQNKGRGSS